MRHVVTAAAVQITAAGRTHFLETGAVIPKGVNDEVLNRLVREGLISELKIAEVAEVPRVQVFTQADVDAAVKAAADANEAELEQARSIVEAEATKVAQAKADLEQAQAAFEASKTEAAKEQPARASRDK